MNCDEARALLLEALYQDQEPPCDRAGAVNRVSGAERHLDACASCRDQLAAMKLARERLAEVEPILDPIDADALLAAGPRAAAPAPRATGNRRRVAAPVFALPAFVMIGAAVLAVLAAWAGWAGVTRHEGGISLHFGAAPAAPAVTAPAVVAPALTAEALDQAMERAVARLLAAAAERDDEQARRMDRLLDLVTRGRIADLERAEQRERRLLADVARLLGRGGVAWVP